MSPKRTTHEHVREILGLPKEFKSSLADLSNDQRNALALIALAEALDDLRELHDNGRGCSRLQMLESRVTRLFGGIAAIGAVVAFLLAIKTLLGK